MITKRVYQFGNVFITATYQDTSSVPVLWGEKNDYRPEYVISIREAGNKNRHSVKAWGNIAQAPDTQHQDLAGLALQEHLTNPQTFESFCGEFGYDTDSRKAEKVWRQLTTSFKNGYWLRLSEDSHAFKLWEKSGEDLANYLKLVKIK